MATRRGRGPTLIQQSRRESPEQKALWNQVQGAGKSHVKREFLGLADEDEQAIATRLQGALEKRLRDLS